MVFSDVKLKNYGRLFNKVKVEKDSFRQLTVVTATRGRSFNGFKGVYFIQSEPNHSCKL